MPLDIDPAWEYWAPDPEINDILTAASARCRLDLLRDHRARKVGNQGFRFGRGNPDHFRGKLAPRKYTPETVTLQPVECRGCGVTFQPDRAGRKYCSAKCVPHAGRDRELPDVSVCLTCGMTFRPRYATHRYCSPWCSSQAQRPATSATGCKLCGQPIPPSRSRNPTPREYCSKRCKHAATARRCRRRLAGGLEQAKVAT